MAYMNGVVRRVLEADADSGVFLGEFSDDIGLSVVNSVIGACLDISTDFGGNTKDVSVSGIVEKYGDSFRELAKDAGIKQAEAKKVLLLCSSNLDAIKAYR